jgi:hypothetical protein
VETWHDAGSHVGDDDDNVVAAADIDTGDVMTRYN